MLNNNNNKNNSQCIKLGITDLWSAGLFYFVSVFADPQEDLQIKGSQSAQGFNYMLSIRDVNK